MTKKTFSLKAADVNRKWFLVDADGQTVGRVATQIARLLTGKDKPTYTPHIDDGDYVVVINAANVVFSGEKEIAKKYYRHSGFPGGIRELTAAQLREKFPERIIQFAIQGMLPKNKLQDERMKRLRIFAGSDHDHTAQTPKKVEVI